MHINKNIKKYILIFILLVCFIFIIRKVLFKFGLGFYFNIEEGFTNDLIHRFLNYQKTVNENNHHFDMSILEKQVSPEEMESYLSSGYWNWDDELIRQYLIAVGNNKIIKVDPGVSLNKDMRLYNKNAITELLAWNTKEGEFLLSGIDLGVSPTNNQKYHYASLPHNTIKCATDSNGNSYMEKTIFNGIDRQSGSPIEKKMRIDPAKMESEIPGFTFKKNKCDPCVALDSDYSCPFTINVLNSKSAADSSIWSRLFRTRNFR